MGHKTRIMYIECKAGNLTGPARIGRVTYSKTGATIYYRGKEFRSLKGAGFKATTITWKTARNTGFLGHGKMAAMLFTLPTFQQGLMTTLAMNTG